MIRLVFLILVLNSVSAQSLTSDIYNIGTPSLRSIWVDHNLGNDSNSGDTPSSALKTISAAWNRIPINTPLSEGIHIKIKAGNYPSSSLPNYWENRIGTYQHPIILEAIDGVGTVNFGRDINAFNIHYFYLIGLNIHTSGDSFHCEQCHYTLMRKMSLSGGDREAHETIKVNQSRNFFLEDSIIQGADDNAIDLVAVQYGHILNNTISNAGDWCVYVKGGSAYLTIAGNEIFNCGTGGFTAGQGTGLEFMTSPWLHYEAYDIKVFNNIIHHTEGAGLGVNGGYNIFMGFNTLYHIGERSHVVEFVFGERSCDGYNSECAARVGLGGWGPANNSILPQYIPNKNVTFVNNIVFNPLGVESQWQHLAIYGPRSTLIGTNIPSPSKTDQNLIIKNNIFWNGGESMPLGIGDSNGCTNSNPTCNEGQLLGENYFNTVLPQLRNPSGNDFRPTENSNLFTISPIQASSFLGTDRETTPLAPLGNLNNQIPFDRGYITRTESTAIGAYALSDSPLNIGTPVLPPTNISVENIRVSKRRILPKELVRISCLASGEDIQQINLRVGNFKIKEMILRNGHYRTRLRLKRIGRHQLLIQANSTTGERNFNAGYLRVRSTS